jgi:hypothetical protein
MVSGMDEPYCLVLLSALISIAVTLFILSLTQQDTLAQRQQIPGIKYDITNTLTTTTLSNTTDLPEIGLDTNSDVSTESCNMPPCPPGEMLTNTRESKELILLSYFSS